MECEECGEAFEEWDDLVVVSLGAYRDDNVQTYGQSKYYHERCRGI